MLLELRNFLTYAINLACFGSCVAAGLHAVQAHIIMAMVSFAVALHFGIEAVKEGKQRKVIDGMN